MRKVFISFCHSKGFGNCIKEIDYKIESANEIRELERLLMEKNQVFNVAILNIVTLPIK